MGKDKHPINTSATIARLIKSEGWTDHVANEIDRYVDRLLTERQKRKAGEIEEAFSEEISPELGASQRMVLGRWCGLHKARAFEAGLRTGLGVRIHQSRALPDRAQVEDSLKQKAGPVIVEAIGAYHEMIFGDDAEARDD